MSAEADREIDVKVTASTTGLATGLSQARTQVAESVEQIKGHFESLNNAVSMVRNAFLAIGTVVAGGEMFEHAIEQTSEFAVQLEVLHEQTGINVESLSALKYVADITHTSFETLSTALGRFARNLYQSTITTTSTTSVALRELGIQATTTSGQLRPMESLLFDVANRFHGMQDGTEKAAIAMSLFGRSGTQLIPFLNQGEAGIRALMERAKELGVTLDESGVQKAIAYRDAVVDLEAVGRGLEQTLGIELMPALTDIARAFVDGMQNGGAFKTIMDGIAYTMRVVSAAVIGATGALSAMNTVFSSDPTSADDFSQAWAEAGKILDDTNRRAQIAMGFIPGPKTPLMPDHPEPTNGVDSDTERRKREALADAKIGTERDAKLQALQIERDELDQKHAMHQVDDATYLASQQDLSDREFDIKRSALLRERAAADGNVQHQAQINDQLIQLETQHQAATSSLVVRGMDTVMKQVDASWQSILTSVGGYLDTFASKSNTVFGRVLGSFVAMSGKMLLQHIATEEAKNMVTAQAWLQRGAIEAAGYAKSLVMHVADALKWIAIEAAKAAAGAWAAMASIPYVGPIVAPAVAAAALAGVAALGSQFASAAGGYDIPAGTNPVTQLHAREMVLPAHLADAVRGMAGQGGASPAGSGGETYHVTINAVDSKSFEDFARRNPRGFAIGVKAASRNGHLPQV